MGYYSHVLARSSIKSLWKFDETSGATAVDSCGSFNGTYNGCTLGVASMIPSVEGGCVQLDGVDDWIAMAAASDWFTNYRGADGAWSAEFTITMAAPGASRGIVTDYYSTGDWEQSACQFGIYADAVGCVACGGFQSAGGYQVARTDDACLSGSVSSLITVTRASGTAAPVFYVGGVAVARKVGSGQYDASTGDAYGLNVGKLFPGWLTTSAVYSAMKIQGLSLYTSELSAEEIAAGALLWNGGSTYVPTITSIIPPSAPSLQENVAATVVVTCSDSDGGSDITDVSFESLPTGWAQSTVLAEASSSIRVATITVIPASDAASTSPYIQTIKVTDAGGLYSGNSAYSLTVSNTPPVVSELPACSYAIGSSAAIITLSTYCSDINGHTLGYAISHVTMDGIPIVTPSWITCDSSTGVITFGAIDNSDIGSYVIYVSVTDSESGILASTTASVSCSITSIDDSRVTDSITFSGLAGRSTEFSRLSQYMIGRLLKCKLTIPAGVTVNRIFVESRERNRRPI